MLPEDCAHSKLWAQARQADLGLGSCSQHRLSVPLEAVTPGSQKVKTNTLVSLALELWSHQVSASGRRKRGRTPTVPGDDGVGEQAPGPALQCLEPFLIQDLTYMQCVWRASWEEGPPVCPAPCGCLLGVLLAICLGPDHCAAAEGDTEARPLSWAAATWVLTSRWQPER